MALTPPHLLTDGRVLVAGGSPDGSNVLSSTQVYDPATNSWSAPVSMGTARSGHTATLVSDGRVVVAGGFNTSGSDLATTDIYNPATNNWSPGASLNTGRYLATATRIMNNRVLLVGGYSNSQNYLQPGPRSGISTVRLQTRRLQRLLPR